MVFHRGDITDYAVNIEYKKKGEALRRLKVPFFTAFGNHDTLATGESGYRAMFRELNYSLIVLWHKFILVKANHEEFILKDGEAPNIDFLSQEVSEQSNQFKNIFMVSHMEPFHREIEEHNKQPYYELMLSDDRFKLSMHGHGHSHRYGELYTSGFDYLQVYSRINYVKLIPVVQHISI